MRGPWLKLGLAVGAALAVLVGIGCLAWIGGEMRYRNCLTTMELRYPVAYQQPTNKTETQFGYGPQPRFVFYNQAGRDNAIDSCSRWPF